MSTDLRSNQQTYFRWREKIERMKDLRYAIQTVGDVWAEVARSYCPIGVEWGDDGISASPSGRLRDSIRFVFDGPARGYLEMLQYGEYVVKGHRAYTISPGKTMRFYWPKVADVVYARSVDIPAQPANDFVQRAWESRRVQETLESLPVAIRRRAG